MRVSHCICVLLMALATPATAQPPATQPKATGYTLFVRGQPAGHETVTVRAEPSGFTLVGEGRASVPVDVVLRHVEIRYTSDWSPASLALDATVGGQRVSIATTFQNGQAVSTGVDLGQLLSRSDPVSPHAIVLPSGFWGAYAAIARRLAGPDAPTELRAYVAPVAEVVLRVASSNDERMQIGTSTLRVRRYELVTESPGGPLTVQLTAAEDGSLVRVSIPTQGIDVVRDDLASSASRTLVYSNPGDEGVLIPAVGFNLGATLTRPSSSAAVRLPAVILLADSATPDRDGTIAGIATLGQLAGALANKGFLVVRYDKRGFGQSGGRAESATISDAAEDLRSVVKWLERRKDVDDGRIAVVGHGEGAWVALLAASRDKHIAAVVTMAAPSGSEADLILEQQQHALDVTGAPPADRASKVALQKQIMTAVLTGKGWDDVPPAVRHEADTPWFQSLLRFDLAKVVGDVKQPILIVHGDRDRQIPVAHADHLATLAKTRHDRTTDVEIVHGVNHLLVPGTTGEISEYASLTDRTVGTDVTAPIASWLDRAMPAKR